MLRRKASAAAAGDGAGAEHPPDSASATEADACPQRASHPRVRSISAHGGQMCAPPSSNSRPGRALQKLHVSSRPATATEAAPDTDTAPDPAPDADAPRRETSALGGALGGGGADGGSRPGGRPGGGRGERAAVTKPGGSPASAPGKDPDPEAGEWRGGSATDGWQASLIVASKVGAGVVNRLRLGA
jgi:hypothetical protein